MKISLQSWGNFILGRIQWEPPAWISRLVAIARGRVAWARANPRQAIRRGSVSALTILILSAGVYWYRHLPRATTVLLEIRPPAVTRINNDHWEINPLRILFKTSVSPLNLVNKEITTGVQLSPVIDGKWRWVGDKELQFMPKEDWPVGQNYKIDLAKKGFVAPHIRLDNYHPVFQTAPFSVSLGKTEFYQDPVDAKLKKVVTTVIFSHPVDEKDFEKRISMVMAEMIRDEKYPTHITYDRYKLNAFVHSDPVGIPDKDAVIKIIVAEGVRSTRGGTPLREDVKKEVVVPGRYNLLQVDSAALTLVNNDRLEPEQVITIHTTTAVGEKEMNDNVTAYILPVNHPNKNEDDGEEPYAWEPDKVGSDILKISRKLDLEPIETEKEYSSLHSYKYQADVGRYIYIRVNKGIKSFGGYILAKQFDITATVPEFPRELKILSKGSLLSLGGEEKVSYYVRDVDAVKFEIGRVLPSQIQNLVTQTYGEFPNPTFNNDSFGKDNITELFSEIQSLPKTAVGKSQYFGFDLGKYLNADGERRGLFLFKVSGYDKKRKQTTDESDSRLILITDMGLLVKKAADGGADVFVVSIATGGPVSGAIVQVIGKNGQPVMSQVSDEAGHIHLPTLKDFKRERAPALYLATKDNDMAFLPFDREDRVLNMSRFDVGGVASASQPDKLSAYLFSDRGVYRPGDTIIVGAIVKSAGWQSNLKGIPLEAVVMDARGLVVKREKIRLSASGFEEVRYATLDTASTGTYTINLHIVKDDKVAGLLGSTTVRVREFLPDRLKISATFSSETTGGWVAPAELKARISLFNLFGTPATNRKVTASIDLKPVAPAFPQYKDFIFFDLKKADEKFTEELKEETTNDSGQAEFDLGLRRFKEATYRLHFMARGFDAEGGRGVGAERSILVSPLARLAGYKADGDLHYIAKDSKRSVTLIVIDPALKKVAADDLKAAIIERRHISVLTKQEDDTYKYESVVKETVLSEKPVAITPKGLVYVLPTAKPGDLALEIRDSSEVVLSRVEYTVAGHSNFARSLDKNAELQLVLNKTDYNLGDEIELEIRAPYTGAGLITIEKDKVYSYKWFKTDFTSTIQRITLPPDFEGNGYVSVAFVRDIHSSEIFMSPLSYGVVPFSVSLARRTAMVTLTTPATIEPGSLLKMRYKTDRPASIVIYAIDEGILQVAGYKTPNPLQYFFQKKALEVKTAQILDLILPEFKVLMSLSAPGGDEDSDLGKNLNPFKRKQQKPAVYWSGIISADTKEREISYTVPDYFNGAIRIMAVAVAPDAIGVTGRQIEVRGNFVISPNVPSFAAPGDEFEVGVTVANNVVGSGENAEVVLELKTSDHVELLSPAKVMIKVPELKERATVYKLRAKDKLGSADFDFIVGATNKSSHLETSMSVRPTVPFMTTLQAGHVRGSNAILPVTRQLYPEYRSVDVGVSTLPLILTQGLASYLEKFEYGCTEQLVSQAMPAIILRNRPGLGYAAEKADTMIATIMPLLHTRQNADGGFGTWAAVAETNDFASVYVMHFLLEAAGRNIPVPQEMLSHGIKWLSQFVVSEGNSLADERIRAYGVYLLTRKGVMTSNQVTAIRERLEAQYPDKWKTDLAAVYLAATYQLLRQEKIANDLISSVKVSTTIVPDYHSYYDGLIYNTQLIYILARQFPWRLKLLEGNELTQIATSIASGKYNSLSSAYTILALDTYAQTVGEAKPENISVSETKADGSVQTMVLPSGLFPKMPISDAAKSVQVESRGDATTYYLLTEAGFDHISPQTEIKQGLEIIRELTNEKGELMSRVDLGSDVEVRIKLRSLSTTPLHDIAIVDLLPGGFEVVMESRTEEKPQAVAQSGSGEGEEGEDGGDSGETFTWVSPIGTSNSSWQPVYADVREDRVVLYGSATPEVKEFIYKIRATNVGVFALPPTMGESMYDRTVVARSTGGKVTVEKKSQSK